MAIKIRKRQDDGGRRRDGDNSAQDPIEMEPGEKKVGIAPAGSDPILDATMHGVSWAERNRGLVIGAAVVLLLASIGGWIYSAVSSSQEVDASQALSPALWDYEVLVEGSPTLEQIQQSDVIPAPEETFASEDARWQAIYETAGEALSENKSGSIAQSARVTRAAAALHLKKNDEAIDLYEEYLSGEVSEPIVPFVYLGLANAYASKGEVEKAAANYEKLVEQNEDYAAMANFQKAKLYDAAGKTDQARELYHQILETNPKTPHRDEIERRLAIL
jgi:tetratricopeptide (TPR) repeat protein